VRGAALLLQFLLCALLIGRAGFVLSHSADRIARATGLTGGWIGLALLATVTSLPELASGISAVAVVRAPNLAVGNVLGACVFNLLVLAAVDALQRRQPLYRHASDVHLLSAAFGLLMLGLVVLGLTVGRALPTLLNLGWSSPLLLGLYLVALRNLFRHERAHAPASVPGAAQPPVALRRELLRFGAAAVVVLLAGLWLPDLADQLATLMGWNRSFVGTLFMALITTLPELAVTLGALRLGALDMAIGNLLGSNLFNLLILAVDDLFYRGGPLLSAAAPVHIGSAGAAIVMSSLVLIGLILRPHGRLLRLVSWVSAGLIATYVVNVVLVFVHGA
jgi:cation:H+ antiporter